MKTNFNFQFSMNLFILSLDPAKAAEQMMDKHVNKILLEAVQMLCTAKRILDPDAPEEVSSALYKLAHKNHPVTIWCRTSRANFIWALDHADALHAEWKYRYGHPETKIHKSYQVAQILRANIPADEKFPCSESCGVTPFALAMPDQYKDPEGDAVKSYRAYYLSPEKKRIASWKKLRAAPGWYTTEDSVPRDPPGLRHMGKPPSTPSLRHMGKPPSTPSLQHEGLREGLRRVRLTRLNITQGTPSPVSPLAYGNKGFAGGLGGLPP